MKYTSKKYLLLPLIGIILMGCGRPPEPPPMEIPSPPPSSAKAGDNGPLSDTRWSAFACHVYSGPYSGDYLMDPSNTIFFDEHTTTLRGDFWGDLKGTYTSQYLDSSPDFVMPTAPRIYVFITRTAYIEIIQGSHADYGTIMWVKNSKDGDRVDYYFRSMDKDDYDNINNGGNSTPAGQWETSSLAGTTMAGSSPGTGTAARFSAPQGIAVDSSGNIYVADTGNNRIRKITPSGDVTNFAGTDEAGSSPGTGTAARFSAPQGIAVDSSGNIYVADTGNNRIRKITPSGNVTNFAGTDEAGSSPGTGTAARFSAPQGIAVDSSGNIYVADTGNNRIRKITSAGVVTNFAGNGTAGFGNGTGTAAMFSAPKGIAVDSDGNIYVADTGNNRIRKITPSGDVTSLAGTNASGSSPGTGTAARFSSPLGITVSADGNIFVADTGNNRVRKITPSGEVTNIVGTDAAGYGEGAGTAARFSSPAGITIAKNGTIYIADKGNNRIRKVIYILKTF